MPAGDDLGVVVQLLQRALTDHERTRAVLEAGEERRARELAAIRSRVERVESRHQGADERRYWHDVTYALVIVLVVVDIALHLGGAR